MSLQLCVAAKIVQDVGTAAAWCGTFIFEKVPSKGRKQDEDHCSMLRVGV